jgi:ABC-type glycerol-3-phosphate transport system permease component
VNDVHFTVALALLALIPPIAIFVVAQRFLVRGVASTGWRA